MTAVLARHRHTADVITHLVAREFRLSYRRSVLGWLWSIAQPLSRLIILSFVFTQVIPLNVPNYPAFLFTGLIGWSWFSSGVTMATTSVIDRRDLMMRPGLPRVAMPLVALLVAGLDYLTALPVLAVFLLLSGGIPPTAVGLPLVLGLQGLLMLGLGLAFCSANVYVRDVHLLVNTLLLLGFYVTPVFYAAKLIPPSYEWILAVNPMAQLLTMQRQILISGTFPPASALVALALVCASAAGAGYAVYGRVSPTFVDEL